ncbi:hypothetical protein B0H14DRAFT_3444933 [Mycena olivaceomarginata]|nr:hypothetical protein B0H14DRAFT_3444933 [Mycena olivaceomarginata]
MNVNSDTPHNYVYTQSESKNLVALYHARAKRVLFNADKHTVGIEYQVRQLAYKPHSTSYVMLRTVFLSFGRFGTMYLCRGRVKVGSRFYSQLRCRGWAAQRCPGR